MNFLRTNKRPLCIISLLVLVSAGFVGITYGKALWIKKFGLQLKPNQIYEIKQVTHFLQNDPAWQSEKMGQSSFNLGGYGCLVTVLASDLNQLGYKTNPQELNTLFSKRGVYTSSGEVIWYKISEAIPGIIYKYSRVFDHKTIEKDLQAGRLPIVKVRYYQTGVFHWVLIVGSAKDDFLILDPLQQNKQPVKLRTHGKVYAYRVLDKRR